jgi:hypothetical protein
MKLPSPNRMTEMVWPWLTGFGILAIGCAVAYGFWLGHNGHGDEYVEWLVMYGLTALLAFFTVLILAGFVYTFVWAHQEPDLVHCSCKPMGACDELCADCSNPGVVFCPAKDNAGKVAVPFTNLHQANAGRR